MHPSWVLFASQALIAPAVFGFNKPQVRVSTTFDDFDARIMDHWGEGGGKWVKVSKGHPFGGRTFGGAKRNEIRGTRAFGSGYPCGADNQSTVAGRPFPFGVWPLYWDQNFMDADEYGPRYDAIRPRGFIGYVPLKTTKQHFNVTDDEVYYAIGDRESLLPLMVSYVTWCHVTSAWPSKFDPSSPNAAIRMENVIQYFRGSSFALTSPTYNNSFARMSNSELKESTPLPELMEYSPFRKCVDNVTENALAIVNMVPDLTPIGKFVLALSIAGFIICLLMYIVFGAGVYGLMVLMLVARTTFQNWVYGTTPPQQLQWSREEEMRYENYP
ncbi:hypothetical protein FRC16_002894 [Serendipita sp. 398]|nr:hypothetical protein FRC16_002894 [Serendipita sp. 398]